MKAGESCTYKLRAACGAPGFEIKDTTTSTALDKIDVTYVEYDEDAVTKTRDGKRPSFKMSFKNQGKQGSGQKRPPRKDSEGNIITSKKLGEADTDRKPPPLFKDAKTLKDTYTDGGFGQPSTGTYDPKVKGFKTFGTLGQGKEKKGAKDRLAAACKKRMQYVTVTATKDFTASAGGSGSELILL